jgi:hypothetical protein
LLLQPPRGIEMVTKEVSDVPLQSFKTYLSPEEAEALIQSLTKCIEHCRKIEDTSAD